LNVEQCKFTKCMTRVQSRALHSNRSNTDANQVMASFSDLDVKLLLTHGECSTKKGTE